MSIRYYNGIHYLYTRFTRICLRILHISFYVLRQDFTSSRHSISNCCLCSNPQGPVQFVLNSCCSFCVSSSSKRPINSNFVSNTRLFTHNILAFQTCQFGKCLTFFNLSSQTLISHTLSHVYNSNKLSPRLLGLKHPRV